MSDPDDIPADVYEAALAIAEDLPAQVKPDNRTFAARVIGRAIAAERERCAAIIDAEVARILGKQDGGDEDVDRNLRLIAVLLPDLAAKIRKGEAA